MYYATDQEDYEKAWKMLTGQDRERRLDEEKLRGVKKRLVTSREALREKLIILDGGFDDRVIELMKGLPLCRSGVIVPNFIRSVSF